MPTRNIYLKIEQIAAYNPVSPEPKPTPPRAYRRDCMRNMGHESGIIPASEVDARAFTAVVYREYLDSAYTIPKPDKIVAADVNEPVYYARVPGAVVYAHPGDRLRIHVLNGDSTAHSFHVHGVRYGIDSDGAWPLGTQNTAGQRSDEICPGQRWSYTFDVTDDTVGAWPFHDHSHNIGANVNRGLFGGLIVLPHGHPHPPSMALPPEIKALLEADRVEGTAARIAGRAKVAPEPHLVAALAEHLKEWADFPHVRRHHPEKHPVLHVPLFFHQMSGPGGRPAFDSGPLPAGSPPFVVTFGAAGTFRFHCNFHQQMRGTVTVVAGGSPTATFNIVEVPDFKFVNPVTGDNTATVMPGGTVQWVHAGAMTHTVTEDAGVLPSFCLNGRSFVGNTPTIEAETGQKIRWYVFNLDLSEAWHNFHPHGQRFTFADATVDVRSLSPAESFVVETVAPPVLLLPPEIEKAQPPEHRHKHAKPYHLRGDFLVHCHVEMHMMQGLAGLVRARQTVWLTKAEADQLAATSGLPVDDATNDCSAIDINRCVALAGGKWEQVPGDPEVTMMHSALVPKTSKVLYWGYGRLDQSRLFDYGSAPGYSSPTNQPADTVTPADFDFTNLHSAGHAYFDNNEGTLLAHGGESNGSRQVLLFHGDPVYQWELIAPTVDGRFYASTFTLSDGRVLTMFGTPTSVGFGFRIEVYNPAIPGWEAPIALPSTFQYLYYPWTYLLPGGDIFSCGNADQLLVPNASVSRRYSWSTPVDDPARTWNAIHGNRSTGAQAGTSVLLPLRPPNYASRVRVMMMGGNTTEAQQTAEMIDLSAPMPAWMDLPMLNQARPEQVQSVLLPDGRVAVLGGVAGSNGGTPGPLEIFDPDDPMAGWALGPTPTYGRGYHSSALLLADGSVLAGGDPSVGGKPTAHERYFPGYYFAPRPTITSAPSSIGYAAGFTINTPNAPSIAEVVLIRPGAVTHGWNQSQRFVGCAITGHDANHVQAQSPPDGTIAPPGWYLLFIVDGGRIPSVGTWIRLH
jgi:FtsP/CotA-like multicopper oxidase with cupredoxin domain